MGKSNVGDMYPAIVIIVVIGILIAVGLTVLTNIGDSVRQDSTVTAETFNASNGASVSLANTKITTSSAVFTNFTNGASLSTSYFTFDKTGRYAGTSLSLSLAGQAANLNYTSVNVTYTYGQATTATTAIATTATGLGGFPTWLAVIVVVLVAGIIISLVNRGIGSSR